MREEFDEDTGQIIERCREPDPRGLEIIELATGGGDYETALKHWLDSLSA